MKVKATVQFIKSELKTSAKTGNIYQQVSFVDVNSSDMQTVLAEPPINDVAFGDKLEVEIDFNTRFKSMKIVGHTKIKDKF